MAYEVLSPRKALNKAFLKIRPNRKNIELFKAGLINLIDRSNDDESEEFHKNLVTDFLKKTYYDPSHFINTKGRNDLVIHNGDHNSNVGVILEVKRFTNKAEMLSLEDINRKAMQELVLYFLRERITKKNLEIRHLVATNIREWFVFDANFFEKFFAQNKTLIKQFDEFEAGSLSGKTTDYFYKEIAAPAIKAIKREDISFTYFDITTYGKILEQSVGQDEKKLIPLFKVFSSEHLLKLPFANDSNNLNKDFYSELLHIIGLEEAKEKTKKVIRRRQTGERNPASILENAIIQLESLDKISNLENPKQFGETKEERLFNVGLELTITWIKRILFLKLLEAQLISFHNGESSYSFLNNNRIRSYGDLNHLFFSILAKKREERPNTAHDKIPYLNSSLFEVSDIEHKTIVISNLTEEVKLPVLKTTVLKDAVGRKVQGKLSSLEYLFRFLDSYDFASEASEDIQEQDKALINASVLGLIFEKINNYKDGSFFTPGFVTMHMCKQIIQHAVLKKFREVKGWHCEDLMALYNKITDTFEANTIIDSLKICDPAVGSGHFLVSALNEIIAIKSELRILCDRKGHRLKEYQIDVVSDELAITDENGEQFKYISSSPESRRVQETIFREKQNIIEGCLFGVDINPNSAKICRLRLWIELLKSAYYKNDSDLETLPNIRPVAKVGVESSLTNE